MLSLAVYRIVFVLSFASSMLVISCRSSTKPEPPSNQESTSIEDNLPAISEKPDVLESAESITKSEKTNDANSFYVTNAQELKSAIASAKPNNNIILKNGYWEDIRIHFRAKAKPQEPITLTCETPGHVVLTGNSKLILSEPYLIVSGIRFEEGAIRKGTIIRIDSDYCSVLNTSIVDYNPAQFRTEYSWIRINGSNNTVEHCYFEGKNNLGPLIHNHGHESRNNAIRRCYFKDIPLIPKTNGREIIRVIGPGHDDQLDSDGAFCTIEKNLFENADGEGIEIISLKSSRNLVQQNVVISSCGGFVSRRGGYNVFKSNIFLGNKKSGTFGIRLSNQHHIVENNFFADLVHSGVALMSGEFIDSALTQEFHIPQRKKQGRVIKEAMYTQVRNCKISKNTIFNTEHGVELGRGYKKNWSSRQLVLLPELNNIQDNLICNSKKAGLHSIEQDQKPPLSQFAFRTNSISSNSMITTVRSPTNIQGFKNWKNENNLIGANPNSLTLITSNDVGPNWMRSRK